MNFPKGFAGTEHYREKASRLGHWRANTNWSRLHTDYQNDTTALCDHIDEQDEEIGRLKGVVEHHMRKAHDEHARWSGYYYEECTKNVDLRFRIAQLEKKLSTRVESSEEKP